MVGIIALMLLGAVVFAVALASAAARAERVRQEMLWNWAVAQGWSFQVRGSARWAARLPGLRRRRLGVTMTGWLGGRPVTVAEYSYDTEHGSSSGSDGSTTWTTHHFIAVMVLLHRPYPAISIQPRGAFSQLGRAIFGDKPTATGNGSFDSRFRIKCGDPVAAKALVGPALIDAQMAGAVPPWSLVGAELLSCTAVSGKLRDPNMIFAHAAPLVRVADLLGR
ncbi:hypothetical protein [Nocardia sp. NPDC056100]|uniref:hypothetical protein n=1 Tax=Nocardia sp. NPDC056100 TaxID=3345712 RepID=UPI0035D6B42F